MLSAFFDIQQVSGKQGCAFGKLKKTKAPGGNRAAQEPRPAEAGTTSVHAKFVPLSQEKNVPKPAEVATQQWRALSGSGVKKEDDVSEFKPDVEPEQAGVWDEEDEEMDDMSEPDFEPESLDPLAAEEVESSLSSSLEDDRSLYPLFFRKSRPRGLEAHQAAPVYSGPQLCCEEDDFED